MGRFSFQYILQMLTYAAREYLAACKNHTALSVVAHVARVLVSHSPTRLQHFTAEDRKKV
jgi:hypothetical protein